MRLTILLFALLFSSVALSAQTPELNNFDTLLIERFESDPTPGMLQIPSGFDQDWVNFDQDGFVGNCVNAAPTPNNWYWEGDFSEEPPSGINSCYTSCSYFDGDPTEDYQCMNWLILPPVLIPDSFCILEWKSLSFQGPAFLDGYQVLVSTSGNDVFDGVFTDTLFTAASMVSCPNLFDCGSIVVGDYSFTPGYIHADAFTNPDYYFYDPEIQNYRGKLEPHTAGLSQYAGKIIYIAFLHDSNNDNILQLDDILVVDQKTSGTGRTPGITTKFSVVPNPAVDKTVVQFSLKDPAPTLLEVRNATGQLMHSAKLAAMDSLQRFELNVLSWPAGVYSVQLLNENGVASLKLVK